MQAYKRVGNAVVGVTNSFFGIQKRVIPVSSTSLHNPRVPKISSTPDVTCSLDFRSCFSPTALVILVESPKTSGSMRQFDVGKTVMEYLINNRRGISKR